MPASNSRLAFAAAAALYLTLSTATGLWWEWEHDEGVTWAQTFGMPAIASADQDSPIEQAYRRINGQTDRTSLGVLSALGTGGGMHPPAYYLLFHQWADWFGTQRLTVRLPIYLSGLLSLLAIRGVARRLLCQRAGTWAMFLLAASPWFVGFSNLSRPYALALCAALVSTNTFLMALESGKLRWRLAFVSASLLGLYTIYPYVYVLGWQLATWFVCACGWGQSLPERQNTEAETSRTSGGANWSEFFALASVTLLIALCFAPWLPQLLAHLELTAGRTWYFSGTLPWADVPERSWWLLRSFVLGEALRAFGATGLRTACAVLITITAGLGAYALLWRPRSAAPIPAGPRAAWACMLLVPLAMALADQLRDTHTLFLTRQSFALFPLLLLCTVRVLTRHRIQWLGTLALACWLALLAGSTISNVYTRARTATAVETVAKILKRSDRSTTRLILSGPVPGFVIPLLLTLRDEGVRELRVQYASGEELYQLVESAIRDEEHTAALRLVNFAGRYRTEDRWSDRLLTAVERRASAVGWRVRSASPGPARGMRGESPPALILDSLGTPNLNLLILTPVGAKSFDL